ncbi:MAG: hypothetical protein O210_OD1C00001G0714 [Parcubacteria bacterium RAAC4_OD1_1]|nr:MAG: hypothetical protein O210_OD1C00001G0714 [Parcubacteria bacterium RAAC4_OD1_1]
MLANDSVLDFVTKKTEKLVTALYMVTDCMETDDALKSKLRLLGVELLSLTFKLNTVSPIEKKGEIGISLSKIKEIVSFIEIAGTIGFISEMNTIVLNKEFASLVKELEEKGSKDKHFSFVLNDKMFEVPNEEKKEEFTVNNSIKDIYNKRTTYNDASARPIGLSFINTNSPLQNGRIKKPSSMPRDVFEKENRINKIISLIKDLSDTNSQKDKNSLKTNDGGVSIRDISDSFNNCSEKTIQRELNSLVEKGKLKKTGSKRWSRYSIN